MKELESTSEAEKLHREIARLNNLSIQELRQKWCSLYGTNPHQRCKRKILTAAIAYRMQERVFGGLKPSVRRVLERVAEDSGNSKPLRFRPIIRPLPGTVLIRDWRGKSHHVKVLEHGVLYRDKQYDSLSEVARVITGSRWSGPLFFGLKGRGKVSGNGSH